MTAGDGQLSPADRQKKLRAFAEANFDFTDMERTTLSYHWHQLTPQQRDQFVSPFTSFMENVYLSVITRGVLHILRAFTFFTESAYSSPKFLHRKTITACSDWEILEKRCLVLATFGN